MCGALGLGVFRPRNFARLERGSQSLTRSKNKHILVLRVAGVALSWGIDPRGSLEAAERCQKKCEETEIFDTVQKGGKNDVGDAFRLASGAFVSGS